MKQVNVSSEYTQNRNDFVKIFKFFFKIIKEIIIRIVVNKIRNN